LPVDGQSYRPSLDAYNNLIKFATSEIIRDNTRHHAFENHVNAMKQAKKYKFAD
jgi:hypothetical protein